MSNTAKNNTKKVTGRGSASKLLKKLGTNKEYSILVRPIFTEKTSFIGNSGNTVVFEVLKSASKEQVAEAVKRVYGKDIASVRTLCTRGKAKRTAKSMGMTRSYKKAYITLKEGQSIDFNL